MTGSIAHQGIVDYRRGRFLGREHLLTQLEVHFERFITQRERSRFFVGCWTVNRRLFFLQSFSYKTCPAIICRIQLVKSKTRTCITGGAGRGGSAQRGGGRTGPGSTGRRLFDSLGEKSSLLPASVEDTCRKCIFESTNKRNTTVDFRNFIVFFGPKPWHIEIRHRVKIISNQFGRIWDSQIEISKIEIMETDRM